MALASGSYQNHKVVLPTRCLCVQDHVRQSVLAGSSAFLAKVPIHAHAKKHLRSRSYYHRGYRMLVEANELNKWYVSFTFCVALAVLLSAISCSLVLDCRANTDGSDDIDGEDDDGFDW